MFSTGESPFFLGVRERKFYGEGEYIRNGSLINKKIDQKNRKLDKIREDDLYKRIEDFVVNIDKESGAMSVVGYGER